MPPKLNPKPKSRLSRKQVLNLFYIFAALIGVMLVQGVWTAWRQVTPIPYSEFLREVEAGKVADVVVSENYVQGTLKEPLPQGGTRFVTRRVDPDLARALEAKGVRVVGATEESWLGDILSWVVPVLLFFGLWMVFF